MSVCVCRRPLRSVCACLLGTTILTGLPVQAQDALDPSGTIELAPIVITARKVEEDLQDATISVTVLGEESLGTGRTDEIRDLDKQAPNVTSFQANGTSFAIRGVGSQALQGINNEMGVGVFIDDVYVGREFGVPTFLDDLERVEVVRGSQSTLYGKNTIGGAVNLIARRPGDAQSGEVELSYGTDNFARARVGADMPFDEGRVRTRAFLSYTQQDGTVENIFTGQDISDLGAFGGRISAEADIGEATFMRFTADYERLDDDGLAPWAPVDLALRGEADLDLPSDRNLTRGGTALRFDHDFGNMTFSSITGYRAYDYDLILDGDFISRPYDPLMGIVALQQGQVEEQWQFSQEFRLNSAPETRIRQAGNLRWKAGLFYSYEDFDGSQFYDVVEVSTADASRNALDAQSATYSVYADIGYFPTDRLEISAGGRYTYERKSGEVTITSPSGSFFFGPAARAEDTVTFSDFSPEFGISYEAHPGVLTYAKVTKGYKSGGISQFLDADGTVNVYDPETAWSYEVGVKSELLDNRLRLNANVFFVDWQDQQSNVFVSDFQRIVANASSATSKGFEIEAQALLADNLSLSASYGYLDAQYDDFVFSFFSSQLGQIVTEDFSGNDIPYAPKHTASLALDWTVQTGRRFDVVVSPVISYKSSYTFDPVGTFRQDPTTLVDLNMSLQGDNWTASVWGRNLTDESYLDNYFLFSGVDYGIAAPGRSIGATFSAQF